MAGLSDIGTSCRYEAVTLPEKLVNMEVEQPMTFSEADATRFRGMVSLGKFFPDLDLIVSTRLNEIYHACSAIG